MFAWSGNDGNAYASFSNISLIQPPSNLMGDQQSNDFGICYELFNVLEWEASSSDGVAGYYVYINGVRSATLGASITTYQDHNQQKGASTTYGISSFDENGNESSAISIVI
jgi:hypothetical protein